jgi:hypothetical protein
MSKPLTILLADDQAPSDFKHETERTKEEIRREFAVVRPTLDIDKAFADDDDWFNGLLRYLTQTKGETVVCARTFEDAKQRLANGRVLDVAIVDLSWWGDYTLPQGASHRNNVGLKLLAASRDGNRPKLPIISLSQNFSGDFELMSTVLERGALPMPKNYQARELAYRALYAAIQYLTRDRHRSGVEVFISHAHDDKQLAEQLVTAIDLGLQVPPAAIRCTSVPGYDFAPGTDFIETLKNGLSEAVCVIGLLTPHSVKSQWCLFELGAAWGLAQKTLFLSLGAETLGDPPAGFRSIQASQLCDAGQLRRFLDEIAKITGWRPKNRSAAESQLDRLAHLSLEQLARLRR